MVDACKLLGVDGMTLHCAASYGTDPVKELEEQDFAGKDDHVAQTVKNHDFHAADFNP